MNTNSTNDATIRELSDTELGAVAGGHNNIAKIWMQVMGATPTQGEATSTGSPLTPSERAKYA